MKKEEEYEYRLWIDEIGKENQVKYIKETDKLQDFYRLDKEIFILFRMSHIYLKHVQKK